MKYVEFDESRKMDIVFLGRIAIDFNPIDYLKPVLMAMAANLSVKEHRPVKLSEVE